MSENLLSFRNRGMWDNHGGHAEEHREEMEEIAREIYAAERAKDMEKIERMVQEKCTLRMNRPCRTFCGHWSMMCRV